MGGYWVMKAYVFRRFPPNTISLYFYPSTDSSYPPPPQVLTSYAFHPVLSVYIFTPVDSSYFPQYIHFIFSQVLISYIFSLALTSYIFCSELTAYILRLVGQTADQYRLKKYDFKKSFPGAKRRKCFGPY